LLNIEEYSYFYLPDNSNLLYMAKVAMPGAGFIGDFFTHSLHGLRSCDGVHIIYSRDELRGKAFAKKHGVKKWTTLMKETVSDPEVDLKEKKAGRIIQKIKQNG
jgi:hypothetical protein